MVSADLCFFFFSSRRRHTRFDCDWSSDVCSSDLLKYATDLGSAYTVSAGNPMPTITLTGDGWTATLTNVGAGQTCAVFMGSTPARPATKEGAPACEESGSATVTP